MKTNTGKLRDLEGRQQQLLRLVELSMTLNSTLDLGTFHLLTVASGASEATLRVGGKAEGKRERKRGSIVIEEITVGARHIDMQGSAGRRARQ